MHIILCHLRLRNYLPCHLQLLQGSMIPQEVIIQKISFQIIVFPPRFFSFITYKPFAEPNDRLACFEISNASPGVVEI